MSGFLGDWRATATGLERLSGDHEEGVMTDIARSSLHHTARIIFDACDEIERLRLAKQHIKGLCDRLLREKGELMDERDSLRASLERAIALLPLIPRNQGSALAAEVSALLKICPIRPVEGPL